jgi:hypothetical protein
MQPYGFWRTMAIAWSRRTRQSLPVEITFWGFGIGASMFMSMSVYEAMEHIHKRDRLMERNIKKEVGKDIVVILREVAQMKREMEEIRSRLETLETGS